MGEFYQVPPIGGKLLLRKENVAFAEPWEAFSMWKLEEVMRQREDKNFAETLNRLRIRKSSESISKEDKRLLMDRISCNIPQCALHLFPFCKTVAEHNRKMTDLLSTEKRKVTAVDILQARTGGAKRRTDPLSVDSNLPAEMILRQGSRVMMTANVDVDDGLVNGVMGTAVKIIEGSKPLGQPQAVCVFFDDERVGANSRLQNPPPQDVDPKSVVVQGHTQPLNHGGHKYTKH